MTTLTPPETEQLTRRGLRLAQFTVAYNIIEGVVAIAAGITAGVVSLVGIRDLILGTRPETSPVGIGLLVASCIVMPLLAWRTRRRRSPPLRGTQ